MWQSKILLVNEQCMNQKTKLVEVEFGYKKVLYEVLFGFYGIL